MLGQPPMRGLTVSAAPSGKPATDKGASVPPESFWRDNDSTLSDEPCRRLSGIGGAKSLGKGCIV